MHEIFCTPWDFVIYLAYSTCCNELNEIILRLVITRNLEFYKGGKKRETFKGRKIEKVYYCRLIFTVSYFLLRCFC